MADESHPTRAALLNAGLTLAETSSLAATSVEHVVRAAGVSKGTFYVHFADRTAFLAALHRTFYERVGVEVRAAMAPHQPGRERLRRGAEAYLDACLRSRGVKAMLIDVRSEATIARQIEANTTAFIDLISVDLAVLGAGEPEAAARLLITMVQEVAVAELDRGAPDPVLRDALWYLSHVDVS